MTNELVALIESNVHEDGVFRTAVPGLHLGRFSKPLAAYHGVIAPTLSIVGQGTKSLICGVNKFVYDQSQYFVSTHELPLTIGVTRASTEKPYLGLRYELDLSEIPMIDLTPSDERHTMSSSGVFLSPMTEELRAPVLRLLQLLSRPDEIRVMSPLLHREILFRILQGPHGAQMRALGEASSRVANAIAWLKKNYIRPFSMKKLADVANMSVSGLHAHFKAVTGMTPLEFQKHLRLHEARRLKLGASTDASTAAYKVGYRSPSQFNREYKRLFGLPPGQEARRIGIRDDSQLTPAKG